MAYKFDPLNYGFEPVSKFPELQEWFGKNAFVKVTAVGEMEHFGRLVYWYHACHMVNPSLHDDDRITIVSHSFDIKSTHHFTEFDRPRIDYSGLISSDYFAKDLLCHLFGTTRNESVIKEGVERFYHNLNEQVHIEREKYLKKQKP